MSQDEKKLSKILIVDDDKNLLEVIKYNLVNEGYTVILAENGTQAVEKARQEKTGFNYPRCDAPGNRRFRSVPDFA